MTNKPSMKHKTCDWCTKRIPRFGEIHAKIDNGGFILCSASCKNKMIVLNDEYSKKR